MTTALGCIACVLTLLFSAFLRDLAVASTDALRAQTAADAAALAAAAESGPYGIGAPHDAARRFAALNGARLTECDCAAGIASAQVEVVRNGVAARARAVLDFSLLAPARALGDVRRLHPSLAAAVETLVRASEGGVWVVSGYRGRVEQERLWRAALARYGTPERADDWVAPPGASMHERGLAVDLGGDVEAAAVLAQRLGLPLHRPLPNEPWHFELSASRR